MLAGEATPRVIFAKMANKLSVSNRLHKTYNPVDVAAVRVGDAAREVGRSKKSRNESREFLQVPPSH
jgi:hypothetical protein